MAGQNLANACARSDINSVMFTLIFAAAAAATSPTPKPKAPPKAAAAALPAADLYSRSARRRMATYLRMRLLELRKEELDRIARVVEGKLRLDDLFASPKP